MQENKIYEVFIQDEWNNITLLGFYKSLDDSIDDINKFISIYGDGKYKLEKGMLKEYPSTFDYCFDTSLGDLFEVWDNDEAYSEIGNVMIRGFIFDREDLLKSIEGD